MLGCKGLIFTTVVNEFPFKGKNFHALFLIIGHNFVDLYFSPFSVIQEKLLALEQSMSCHYDDSTAEG